LLSFTKHPIEKAFNVITIGDEEYQKMTEYFYL